MYWRLAGLEVLGSALVRVAVSSSWGSFLRASSNQELIFKVYIKTPDFRMKDEMSI